MHVLLILFLLVLPACCAQLSPTFYASSCPNVVSIVSNTILARTKQDNVVGPSTLRLILHDCFVEGCDASILLDSTAANQAERDATDNKDLPQNAFNAIFEAKNAVEAQCPGVVSCADILVLATKVVVGFLGGPSWEVALGRRDGTVSTASSVQGRIPGANFNLQQLMDNFGAVGLSLEDLVILSGAHTIGFSHCSQFQKRLYSFSSTSSVDPSIDPMFLKQLQQKCPQGSGSNNLQPFDQITPFVFDSNYYKDLQAGKGLLFSDQVLFLDNSTRGLVNALAASQGQFFSSFVQSIIKMTSIGVKTGLQGEVRKDCRVVNLANSNPSSSPPAAPSSPVSQAPSQPRISKPPTVSNPAPVSNPPAFSNPAPTNNLPRPVSNPPTSSNPAPANKPPAFSNPPRAKNPPANKPPTFSNPAPANNPAPENPNPGFTIPGIPGISPPITIPRFRFPGFGRPSPPGANTSTASSPP